MTVQDLSARARIRIHCPRSDVFAAFADARKMSEFWFHRRDNGLVEGDSTTWFLGADADAYSFAVQVREIRKPEKIAIEWQGPDGHYTQVVWLFEQADDGTTILTIEESGFSGNDEAVIEQALDSTGGFNQVIVAAKAFLEHDVGINVVADHA